MSQHVECEATLGIHRSHREPGRTTADLPFPVSRRVELLFLPLLVSTSTPKPSRIYRSTPEHHWALHRHPFTGMHWSAGELALRRRRVFPPRCYPTHLAQRVHLTSVQLSVKTLSLDGPPLLIDVRAKSLAARMH
jgi:hypothetical protein